MNLLDFIDHDTYIMFTRILIATLLCGVIGLEREFKNHPAGFRTHLLVGIGSCLMMILSLYGFDEYIKGNSRVQFDPSRIPSYVISGIGFLGGGTILVKGATVRGLTTAASIWIVAGLGLIIGTGMYTLAIFTTTIVLMSLIFLNKLEKFMYVKKARKKMKVTVHSNKSTIDDVIKKLRTFDIDTNKVVMTSCRKVRENYVTFYYQLDIDISSVTHTHLEKVLVEIDEVEKIF
ncbi:MgtC/SapB family protein [Metabacillus litoralis]|uniref:MgtC/SapB family protein n=1 Tax=Metabacillus litoralis TaxID=152268 RepID=UPI001CFD112A|nr:MgtC/SapB family protein [Metabacillus litoralis]